MSPSGAGAVDSLVGRSVVEVAWRNDTDVDDGGTRTDQYRGQRVAFATRHGKADLVRAPFASIAGLDVHSVEADTDALGTFTGEIERPGTALDTVVRKAGLGLTADVDLAVASEGSFGPHPIVGFIPVGTELLAFVDRTAAVAIVERSRPGPTRWSHRDLAASGPLVVDQRWLDTIGFGDHAVCVVGLDETGLLCAAPSKGLNQPEDLASAIANLTSVASVRTIRLMTDMRAHVNPTRQAQITELATALASRLTRACPACGQAGWGRIGAEPGLPCRWCATPTEKAVAWIFGCAACPNTLAQPAPGPSEADPGVCPHCNP